MRHLYRPLARFCYSVLTAFSCVFLRKQGVPLFFVVFPAFKTAMAASSGSAAAKPTPGPAWYLPPLGADMSADAWSVAGVGSPASGFYAPPQAPGVATPSGAAPYYSALALEAQARWAAAGGLPPAYGAAAYGLPGSVPPGYAPPAMIPGAAHN